MTAAMLSAEDMAALDAVDIEAGSITQGVDAVISKIRPNSNPPYWQNRLSGVASQLDSSSSGAQYPVTDEVTSFNMNNVSVGTSSTLVGINASGYSLIAYLFKQASGYLDIVGYTGTGVARTEAHNLGVVPELMIIKCRSAIKPWIVYYGDAAKKLELQSTGAEAPTSFWADTLPTSSVFSLGAYDDVNYAANTFIAYLFASCPGVSKIGTYTGTGSAQQIDCGFTSGARFVLIKRIDSTGGWYFWDTTRGIVSGNDPYLLLNSSAVEVTNTDYIDPYSAGFEISSSAPAAINASGGQYLYLAIA